MKDRQRCEIKDALLQCAEENENRNYATCHIVVSSICRSAEIAQPLETEKRR